MPTLKKPTHIVAIATALALGLVACTTAIAQPSEERWYRVELLIFSNDDSTGSEQWPAIPTLTYPTASRFLVDPQQVEANREAHEGPSELDAYGRQFLALPADDSVSEDPATDIPQESVVTAAGMNSNVGEEVTDVQSVGGGALPAELPAVVTPTPFITLPATNREFYGKAAYMQRSGSYTTLFHETWVQPARSESDAIPIVVDRSGDTKQWPRLQGSVKLHISRYLHLETNLWLNTSGDYLPGQWRMPPPPLGPVSLIIEEPEPELTAELLEDANDTGIAFNPLADPVETELAPEPVYGWRHAVLLNQKRRMRSVEVHYIDHPMLGAVIKLTPLDAEELVAMAEVEAEVAAAAAQEQEASAQ